MLLIGTRNSDVRLWRSEALWGGYERLLPPEILHYIGKDRTQRLERTNGIVRQQTGRWLSLRHAARTTAAQIWQIVAAIKNHGSISRELFQLDLAA